MAAIPNIKAAADKNGFILILPDNTGQKLKKIVEKYIHGTKPGKPDTVTGSVSSSAIKVHVAHMRHDNRFQKVC